MKSKRRKKTFTGLMFFPSKILKFKGEKKMTGNVLHQLVVPGHKLSDTNKTRKTQKMHEIQY